ncbi:MAG: carbohydrate kinase family protein [Thermoplasmata archaeon]|nr:carbohydrate kinase family protein [Thermoplasmata archaeon]
MPENYLGVFGHVVVDNIFNVPSLPKVNSSIATTGLEMAYGGTGANIAIIASRLGVRTALASFVGEGFPDEYKQILENAGIDLTDLKAIDGYSTPQAWIFVDPEQNQTTIFHQGPMADAAKFELQRHTIEESQIIHIGTGRPEYYQKVAELASSMGKKIAFDPAQELSYVYSPESFKNVIQYADYFFANESELATALSYLDLKEESDLLDLVKVLIITKGDKGSEIITPAERMHIPVVHSEAVMDITGAGDAYRAGFYAGLQKDLDLDRCGLIGSTVASFVIEEKGPQTNIPTWDQVEDRMDKTA